MVEDIEVELPGRDNSSGIIPMDKRVLVKPDTVEQKTAGGIILLDTEKQQMAQLKATVIAVGETAWSEAMHDARNFGVEFTRPLPGDRVMIAKYGGIEVKGSDGATYRLLNDEDCTARLEE